MATLSIDCSFAPARDTLAALAAHLGHKLGDTNADLALHLSDQLSLTAKNGHTASSPLPLSLSTIATLIATALNATPAQPLSGEWQFDSTARQCTHPREAALTLTDKESLLLSALLANPTGIARDQLIRDIWAHESGVTSHTLETHIYRLRGKLERIEGVTIAAHGNGYMLQR